jgi:ubiquinone/menaquinone biosynthesis C-methylase UbiE
MDTHMHEVMFSLRESIIHAAIRRLDLPAGSRGLDVGCGIGLITRVLAETVAPAGQVTGVDLSAEQVDHARSNLDPDHPGHVNFQQGDVNHLPFDADNFDWVWSMDTIWPGPRKLGCPNEDPFPMVKELVRVVKPGGTVALLFWTAQQLLPGYPYLEARLNTANQAPFTESMEPQRHAMRCLGWLREGGLTGLKASTFAGEAAAPLDDTIRDAMTITFPMFWSDIENKVSADDWAEYNRLCDPKSPDFILNHPDYYALFTYTMFYGQLSR